MPAKKGKKLAKKSVKKVVRKKAALKKKTVKVRKPAGKKPVKVSKKSKEAILGKITHYFPKVRAAVIKLKMPLLVGQNIKIKGHTTDFTQAVASMQIDHAVVDSAKKGQEIGLLVKSRVREHDVVYKV